MADHLTTNLSLQTTEQEHLEIHQAQAARFVELAALTPQVIAELLALVEGTTAFATEEYVDTAIATLAGHDTDVHGASTDENSRVAKLIGGGSAIHADLNASDVPVGESVNDVWFGPPA